MLSDPVTEKKRKEKGSTRDKRNQNLLVTICVCGKERKEKGVHSSPEKEKRGLTHDSFRGRKRVLKKRSEMWSGERGRTNQQKKENLAHHMFKRNEIF